MVEESALGLAFLAQPTGRQLGVTLPSQPTTSLACWKQAGQLSLREVAPDVVAHRESPNHRLASFTTSKSDGESQS